VEMVKIESERMRYDCEYMVQSIDDLKTEVQFREMFGKPVIGSENRPLKKMKSVVFNLGSFGDYHNTVFSYRTPSCFV
jgi:hypothetical protein